ncbi:uncharacterized protein LOC128820303 [Vidua macroura]|uniref:uncharacterized protein LOC128820303 n=1 Tax=Vidua macroura TaxID=187451 RepID=UPI0023A8B49C|nr:uncharacterized protein LOC128820303 [Vidua macroura]
MALRTSLVTGMKLEPAAPLWDVLSQEQAWLCPGLCHRLPRSCLSEPGRPSPGAVTRSRHLSRQPKRLRHPPSPQQSRGLWQQRGCGGGDASSLCSPLSAHFAPEEQTAGCCCPCPWIRKRLLTWERSPPPPEPPQTPQDPQTPLPPQTPQTPQTPQDPQTPPPPEPP